MGISPKFDPPAEPGELSILVLHPRDSVLTLRPSVADRDRESGDVSSAARDVARALAARGHFVEIQETEEGDLSDLLLRLRADRPDLVFNLCTSLRGAPQHAVVVPALLDLLEIPYTGSGPLALMLAQRRDRQRDLLHAAGVPTPRGLLLPAQPRDAEQDLEALRERQLSYPLVLKPTPEGAASTVLSDHALLDRLAFLRQRQHQPILCEEHIEGRAVSAWLQGPTPDVLDLLSPPNGHDVLPHRVLDRCEQAARAAFQALGLSDYGCVELRVAENGVPYVISLRAQCDLAEGKSFALAAEHAGLSYEETIERIAHAALRRHPAKRRRQQRESSAAVHLIGSRGTPAAQDRATTAPRLSIGREARSATANDSRPARSLSDSTATPRPRGRAASQPPAAPAEEEEDPAAPPRRNFLRRIF